MPEANPDPSGSTGEFRAFMERDKADREGRGGVRTPVVASVAVLAVIAVIAVIVLAVR